MKKIVIDKDIPYIKNILEPYLDVVYEKGREMTSANLCDAEAIMIRTRTKCDADLLSGSNVKFIGTATIGFDHIDTSYCDQAGIKYVTASGCNARGVLQYISSALVHLSRVQGWKPEQKTIGVIGVGNVGSLIAENCKRFGFKVICCDPPRARIEGGDKFVTLDELLCQADIITVHVPLNKHGEDKTADMVSDTFFRKVKSGAIFINSSRGEVVVDSALKSAIRTRKLSATVIDVWNHEPTIDRELLDMVTYGTYHIAGYSVQGKANGTAMIVEQIARYFSLPISNWYPEGVPAQVKDRNITWDEVCVTIDDYFNIKTDDRLLRANVSEFETLRNTYNFREEFF